MIFDPAQIRELYDSPRVPAETGKVGLSDVWEERMLRLALLRTFSSRSAPIVAMSTVHDGRVGARPCADPARTELVPD